MTPDDVTDYEYLCDKLFRGKRRTLEENIETMWHMAEDVTRGLLALIEQQTDDAESRDITLYLAKCWLKDYAELDRRVDQKRAETSE